MKTIIFDLDGTLINVGSPLTIIADPDQLQELKEQYNFALVTGSPREEALSGLREAGLSDLFDQKYMVFCEEVGADKSSGKPFSEILYRLGGASVMIGDSDSDETGSRVVGLRFARVERSASLQDQKQKLKDAIGVAVALLSEERELA